MKKEKVVVTEKVCRRCGTLKPIEMFRKRVSGFILNQCKPCEKEMSTARRVKTTVPATEPALITVKTKSGALVEASVNPIVGGRMTTSPLTDKVLYFDSTVTRDTARVAFSAFAEIPRTGINFKSVG